jgi:hypothetical protein
MHQSVAPTPRATTRRQMPLGGVTDPEQCPDAGCCRNRQSQGEWDIQRSSVSRHHPGLRH